MSDIAGLEQEDEKPLDPQVEKIRRRMVRLLAVSIGIMMIGLMAVLGAIVYKIGQGGENKAPKIAANAAPMAVDAAKMIEREITLPAGSRLVSSSLAGNWILLTVELAQGKQQLLLFDMPTSRIIARYRLVK